MELLRGARTAGMLLLTLLIASGSARGQYPKHDVKAVSVVTPADGATLLQKIGFTPVGTFAVDSGNLDAYDTPLRVTIRRCSDDGLVFLADTMFPEIYAGEGPVLVHFPSHQGSYDIRTLDPGCYSIALISRAATDAYRPNDTTRATFQIAPHQVANDITVDSELSRPQHYYSGPGQPISLVFQIRNRGTNDQALVPVRVTVTGRSGKPVFQDSAIVPNLRSSEARVVSFRSFAPSATGKYQITCKSLLPTEEYRFDDSLTTSTSVGPLVDLRLDSVIYPRATDTIYAGEGFTATSLLEWRGLSDAITYVPIHLEIRPCGSTDVLYRADSEVPVLFFGSGPTAFTFASHSRSGSNTNLPPGCYTALIYCLFDQDTIHVADSATTQFNIRASHRLVVDSVLSPLTATNIGASSVPVIIRAVNRGVYPEHNVHLRLLVKAPGAATAEIVNDDVESNWSPGESRDLTIADFVPTARGRYVFYVTALLDSAQFDAHDTLTSEIFCGADPIDVETVGITAPANDQTIAPGEPLHVEARFAWNGGFPDNLPVPLRVEVRDCRTNTVVFGADTILPHLSEEDGAVTVDFPSSQGNYDSRTLPVGCYQLAVISDLAQDQDRSNDTLNRTFTVGLASVYEHGTKGFAVISNHPNPFTSRTTIEYELPAPGRVSVRLIAQDGTVMEHSETNASETAGHHSIIIYSHGLHSGIYVLELSFRDTHGEIQRASRLIEITK